MSQKYYRIDVFEIKDPALSYLRSICYFVVDTAHKEGYYIQLKKSKIVLSKKICDIIDDSNESREAIMQDYLSDDRRARGLFPCENKYSALRIGKKFEKYSFGYLNIDYPNMICPYIRKFDFDISDDAISLVFDVDSKVINTVYENRVDKSVTKEKIKKSYDDFKKDWGPIVEKINSKNKKEKQEFNYRRYWRYSYIEYDDIY